MAEPLTVSQVIANLEGLDPDDLVIIPENTDGVREQQVIIGPFGQVDVGMGRVSCEVMAVQSIQT